MPGQVLAHQVTDALCTQRWFWRLQPQAVRLVELRGWHQTRELAGIDAVGVGHDVAGCRLAEHLSQSHHRDLLRLDQVAQHHTRPHAGQLVDIAHQQHLRLGRNGFEQRVSQEQIQHRGLIHHDGLRFQRLLLVEAELHGLGIKSEHAVNGFGLLPGHLREPLGSTSRRCSEQNVFSHRAPQVHNGFGRKRLAASGSSSQHQQTRGGCQFDCPALLLRKRDSPFFCIPINPALYP